MEATIPVRQRGTITLPAELQDKYGIQAGDTLGLMDLDGIFVLTPRASMVAKLAHEIDSMRLEAGLSIEELLVTLREQREQYYSEHYDREYNATAPDR